MSTAIVRRPGDQVSPATSPVFNTSKLPTDIPGSRLSASRAESMTSMDDELPAGASLSAQSSSSRPTKRKTPPTPESQPKIKLRFAGTRDTSPTPTSAATHSKAEEAQLASRTRSRSPIKTPLTSFPDPPSGVLKRKEVSPNKDATTSGPPKRAPRKKRKWLKKGEVDPDDPVAVARQKERFGIIDQALAELNRQEALVRNGTQWQLQVLEKELDRRRDLQLARLQNSQTAAEEELEYATEHDDHFIRETWRDQAGAIINDVFDKMEADAYRLDREYNFLKKVPGAAPRLRDDYGKGSWGVHVDRLHSTKTVPLVRVQVPGDDRVRYRRDIDITPDYLEPRARAHDCNAFGLRAPRALATWDREDNHPVTGPGIYSPAGNKAWPTWYNARTEPEEWEYILGSERYATLNAEHKQRQERGLKQMAADKKREEDREREKRARASRDPRKEQEVHDAFARLAEAMEQEIKNDEKKRKEEWNKEQEQEWEKYLQRMDHLDKMKEREAAAKAAAASNTRHVAYSSAGQPSTDRPRMDAAITAPKRAASPVQAPHQSLRQVATPAASSSQPRQTAAHRPASPPRAAVTAASRGAPTGSTSAEARLSQTAPVRVSTDTPRQHPAPTSIANLISRPVSTAVESASAKLKPASSASASAAAQAPAAPSQNAASRSAPGVPEHKEPASQVIMDRASSIVHNIKPHGTSTPATTPALSPAQQSGSVTSTAAPQKAPTKPTQPPTSKSSGAMAPIPDRAAAARTTSGTSLQTPQPVPVQATPKSTTPSVQHTSAAKPASSKLPVAPAQTPTTSSSAAKESAASASNQSVKTPASAQEARKLSNGSTPSVLEPPRPTATPAVEPSDPWKVIRPAAAFKAPSDNFLGRFASTKPASVFGSSPGVPQSTFGSSRPYSQQSPSISGTLSFGASASPWGKPATPATPSTPATPLTSGLERKTSSGSFGAFAASSPFARTTTGAPLVLETQLRAWSGETLPPGVTRRRGPADVLLEDEDVTEVDPPPADFDENRPLRERSIRPVAGIPESPHPAVPTIQYNSHEDRYLWRANREWGLTYERRDAIHECHKRWKAAMANKQDILDESAKLEAVIKEQAEIKERLEKLRAKELEEEAERRREERRLNEELRAENRIRLEKEAQEWLRKDKEKQEEKRRYNERMEETRRERERAAEQLKREKADKRNAQARERRRAKKLEDEARREKEARADATTGGGVGTSAGMAPVSKSATTASAATNGSTPRSTSSKQSTPAPATDKTSASASVAARAPASASTGGSAQPKGI